MLRALFSTSPSPRFLSSAPLFTGQGNQAGSLTFWPKSVPRVRSESWVSERIPVNPLQLLTGSRWI
ncbi:hypothetical protein Mapa_016062 [Marchantia paleacea]|nr:hypothetical protein Mapa_016062 [Marchantia paleacea]